MDGLLVIDKPAGPTSHDVVASVRRILQERRVGHTGTLDPIATGVLPLVVGRATRLAQFLSAQDKTYEATIVLGSATDSADAAGSPIGEPYAGPWPSRDQVERALDEFRGTFLQHPPVYSAKKIGGKRSYDLARAGAHLGPPPVAVTVHRLDVIGVESHRVTIRIDCAAGFYVRSLAHDLGERLGTGAHVTELRRTRSGDCTLDEAIALDALERDHTAAASRLIPLARMLRRLPAIGLTPEGVRRARHGQDVRPADTEKGVGSLFSKTLPDPFFRLTDSAGELIGIAEPVGASGLLHPCVVLG